MIDDARTSLRQADKLARRGRFAEAVGLYQAVAEYYAEAGFALKAIAVSQSVVKIIDSSAPELTEVRAAAVTRLKDLRAQLGLADNVD